MSSTTRAQVTDLNGTAEGYPEDFYADDINADEPTTTPIAPPQLRFGLGENLEPVGWVDEDAYADAPHAAADDLDDAEEREQLARQLLAEAWEDRSAAAALADEVPPELAHAPVAATLDRARRAAFHRLAKPSDAAWTLPAPLRRAHRRVRPNDPPAWLRFRGGPIEHRPVFGQRRLVPRLRDYACSAAFFDAFKQVSVFSYLRPCEYLIFLFFSFSGLVTLLGRRACRVFDRHADICMFLPTHPPPL